MIKPVPHLLALAVAAALSSASAFAQQAQPQTDATQSTPEAAPSQEKKDLDQVVITGTRIRSGNQDSPNPITTVTAEQIAYTGKTNVQQIVRKTGALVGSDGDGEFTNGESPVVLRNLGANRTLVLVDGQRMVGGFSGSSAVDLNNLSSTMIERVDVLTGGASAIYGADAVTGVVNFVLKRDFNGFAYDGQLGNAFKGDFRDQQHSFTFGRNFAQGRGNVMLNYTFGERPLTLATKRAQASTLMTEQVNNLNGSVPKYVLMAGTRESFFTDGGAMIDPFGIFSTGFNGDGRPFKHGTNVGSFAGTGEIGGDGIPNWKLFAQGIRPGDIRHVVTLRTHFDVSPAFKPYASLIWSDVKLRSVGQESLTVGSQVKPDNAFAPANVVAAAGGAPIFFNRWDLDAGYPLTKIDKKTLRLVFGANGALGEHASYDASFNFGEMTRTEVMPNNRMYDRYLAATDAIRLPSGQIVCRSNVDPASFAGLPIDFISTSFDPKLGPATFTLGANSGCVPFNPFTTDRASNAAAIAWIFQPTSMTVKNRQQVVNAFVMMDSGGFFNMQGGPATVVLGGEYRKESSDTAYDAWSGSKRVVAFFNGNDLSGSFSVREAFGEFRLPIFRKYNDFLRGLEIDGAARWSDYSTIGKTQTWKLGAMFETVAGLAFRGTLSSAVRAPNVSELFESRSQISISLGQRDPCHTANLDLGTQYRRANCAQALTALGVNPATFNPLLGTYFPAISGGNPNLKAETARTKTWGMVWNLPWVNSLVLSADYFDIRITNAVLRTSQTTIFNACYDAPTLNNIFCGLIHRDPKTGYADFAEISYVNVGQLRTSGYEFSLAHTLKTSAAGTFRTRLMATRLQRLDVQKSLLPLLTDDKGLFNTDLGGSSPTWTTSLDLSWFLGKWDANYGFAYSSKTLRNEIVLNVQRANAYNIIDQPYVKAYRNHDLQVGYQLRENTRLYFGVNNLTDEYPDNVHGSRNWASGRQGYAGRTWYTGVNFKLGE